MPHPKKTQGGKFLRRNQLKAREDLIRAMNRAYLRIDSRTIAQLRSACIRWQLARPMRREAR